jgi:hypothetical protein
MTNYMFAYHGGDQPESPEEGAKHMTNWKKWVADLGDAMVTPEVPLGMSKTVSASGVADDGGANPILGYTVIAAESMDAALKIAQACPFLAMNGTIEVAEVRQMPG